MALFRRRREYSGPVVVGRPWNDPALAAILDTAPEMAPEQAVEVALDFLGPIRGDIERHVHATNVLDEMLNASAEVMRRRAGRSSADDGRTRADLLALLGNVLIDQAWEVRSSRPASQVSQQEFRGFAALLHEADEVLAAALEVEPQHPAAAAARLLTARGLQVEPEELWRRFAEATAKRPTLYLAHGMTLAAICRKWGGSDKEMFDFGRHVAASAPAGDPVVAMLPWAHVEYISSLVMLPAEERGEDPDKLIQDTRRSDLPAVLAASSRWCGDGTGPIPAHPSAIAAHQHFAWFLSYFPPHHDRARWHLERAEGRMSTLPWSYLSADPAAKFRQTHTRLGIV
jgi:hypothetical protein